MSNETDEVVAALVAIYEQSTEKASKASDTVNQAAVRIEKAITRAEDSVLRIERAIDSKAERVAVAACERIEYAAARVKEKAEHLTDVADDAERSYRRWPLWLTVSVIALGGLNGWLAWRNASLLGENSDLVRQNEVLGEKFQAEMALARALQANGSRMSCDTSGECVITLGVKILPTLKDGRVRLVLPARK